MLTPEQIVLIQSTIPVLREQALAITQCMYRRMFAANPEVARMFNPSHMHPQGQQGALAGSILAYAQHLTNPGVLAGALEVICHKHVAVEVTAEQYPIVGGHLLAAIAEVLGDAATPELMAAWAAAYGVLAEVCIGREQAIYREQREVPGGWTGLRRFTIASKRSEGVGLASLWLRPSEGGPLPRYRPGQHVSLALPGREQLARRQYSLARAPASAGDGIWRLVIKAEPAAAGHAPGVVSTQVVEQLGEGDEVLLGPPSGSFVLDPEAGAHPLALLAAGVGITPIFSMLEAALLARPQRPIVLVHAAIDRAHRPLRDELAALAAAHPSVQLQVVHEQPGADERAGVDYHRVGRVDAGSLAELIADRAGTIECHCCGPFAFMRAVDGALAQLDIDASRRHYEFFGPARAL